MILFGTSGITMTKARGTFHCPGCDAKREYRHRRVRRFFTLYFLPVIPLDLVGEYIECQRCKSTFRLEVLDHDPEAARAATEAEFHAVMRLVLLQIARADGEVDDAELAVIRDVCAQTTGKPVDDRKLKTELAELQRDTGDFLTRLRRCAGLLNDRGKELVVTAAVQVAKADGEVAEAELARIAEYASALHMTSTHMRGVFAEALGEDARRSSPSHN